MGASVVEEIDDRIRRAGEIVKRCCDGAALQDGRFIERYVCGELNIGLLCTFGEYANYGFTISCWHEAGLNGIPEPTKPPAPDMEFSGRRFHGEQPLVLTQNVELMERPKRFIPSLVRLDRFDQFPRSTRQLPYKFYSPIVSGREVFGAVSDGKINIVWEQHYFSRGESAGQDVETAPNCIDVGTGLDVECERENAFFARYHDIVLGIRWRIHDDYFDVIMEPGCEALFEIWKLGYGPLYAGFGV